MTFYSWKFAATQVAIIGIVMLIPSAAVAGAAFLFQIGHGLAAGHAWNFALFAFALSHALLWLTASVLSLWWTDRRCRKGGVTFDQLGRLSWKEQKRVCAERGI